MEIMKKEVEFNGVKLTGIKTQEGKIYIIVKTFCEMLGVFWNSQLKRINRDETLREGVVKMTIPSNGGEQEMNLLELDFLPMWLTGIKSNQCKEEIRPYLKEFKLKAKDVLADAFFGKRELVLSSQNDERVNPYLNDIEDRIPIIRSLEADLIKLHDELQYHYNWIDHRAATLRDKYDTDIKEIKETNFTVDGKKLTTEDIDRLNNR